MTQKLYVYSDESGQDTQGRLFIAASVIILAEEQEPLRRSLERIERACGKDKKWTKAKLRQRRAYLEQVLQLETLRGRLFVGRFENTTTYLPCVLNTIADSTKAIAQEPYRATILIDGLQQSVRHEVARELRRRQVRIANVRGINEKNDALMRLADAIAGFARHAIQGRQDTVDRFEQALRRGMIIELQT